MSEQIYTNKVSIVHFYVFMSFYSIYTILSRIRFCRDLRFFCVNVKGPNLRSRKFFDKYHLCVDSGVGDLILIITNLPILGPMKQQPMREQPPASKWTTPGLDFFIGIYRDFK